MFACTFAGHREVYQSDAIDWVRLMVDTALDQDDEVIFYNGGMGEFDKMCARVVNEAKRNNPDKSILHVLVLPYMMARVNRQREYYETAFDEVLVLDLPVGTHYKRAIQARNRWMVDQSDWVIAYLNRDFGGAFETAVYAKRNHKMVVNVCEESGHGEDHRHHADG